MGNEAKRRPRGGEFWGRVFGRWGLGSNSGGSTSGSGGGGKRAGSGKSHIASPAGNDERAPPNLYSTSGTDTFAVGRSREPEPEPEPLPQLLAPDPNLGWRVSLDIPIYEDPRQLDPRLLDPRAAGAGSKSGGVRLSSTHQSSAGDGRSSYYPCRGFHINFVNERSGNTLSSQDLTVLAVNIAERASRLANNFGLQMEGSVGGSASNLFEELDRKERAESGVSNDTDLHPVYTSHLHVGQSSSSQTGFGGTGSTQDRSSSLSSRGDLGGLGLSEMDDVLNKNLKQVLKHFDCPSFGWVLINRALPTTPLIRSTPEIFLTSETGIAKDPDSVLAQLAQTPDFLQLMQNKSRQPFLINVPEIGKFKKKRKFTLLPAISRFFPRFPAFPRFSPLSTGTLLAIKASLLICSDERCGATFPTRKVGGHRGPGSQDSG